MQKSLNFQRHKTREKITELKKKEKIEISKLYQSQNNLESTKNDLRACNNKLDFAKGKLNSLQNQLGSLNTQRNKSEKLAAVELEKYIKEKE